MSQPPPSPPPPPDPLAERLFEGLRYSTATAKPLRKVKAPKAVQPEATVQELSATRRGRLITAASLAGWPKVEMPRRKRWDSAWWFMGHPVWLAVILAADEKTMRHLEKALKVRR